MNDFYFPVQRNEIVNILLSGVVLSAFGVVAAWALSTFLVGPFFCRGNTGGPCGDPFSFSYNFFLIVTSFAAIGWFATQRIFRPALVALPSILLFWSLPMEFGGLLDQGLLTFGLVSVLLTTFSYLVFYWIVRVRNFLTIFIIWLVLMLGVRWLLVL